jgi:hypothetical protein
VALLAPSASVKFLQVAETLYQYQPKSVCIQKLTKELRVSGLQKRANLDYAENSGRQIEQSTRKSRGIMTRRIQNAMRSDGVSSESSRPLPSDQMRSRKKASIGTYPR